MRIGPRRKGGRAARESGASLVEFALVAPFVFVLVFGIIDSGWLFGQHLEVRHGAREGARLAAVNYGDDIAIACEVWNRMEEFPTKADSTVTVTKLGSDIGDTVTVQVTAPGDSLTGFLDATFAGLTLRSRVDIRLEQVAQPGLGTGASLVESAITCP